MSWLDEVFEEAEKAWNELPVWARPIYVPPIVKDEDADD